MQLTLTRTAIKTPCLTKTTITAVFKSETLVSCLDYLSVLRVGESDYWGRDKRDGTYLGERVTIKCEGLKVDRGVKVRGSGREKG